MADGRLRDKASLYPLTMVTEDDLVAPPERSELLQLDDKSSVNVTVALGKTAQLTCRHRGINSSNRTVSCISVSFSCVFRAITSNEARR